MIRLYMDHFRACRSNISNRRHQSTAKRPRISVEVQKDGPLLKRYRCVTTARFKKAVIEIICLRIKAGGDDRELMIFHRLPPRGSAGTFQPRSEEHTSELQSLMRISYAVFCLKKKKTT